MSKITDLLYEAIAEESRSMYFQAACKARRAAVAAQVMADTLKHKAICLHDAQSAIEFEPVDSDAELAEAWPRFMRRNAR